MIFLTPHFLNTEGELYNKPKPLDRHNCQDRTSRRAHAHSKLKRFLATLGSSCNCGPWKLVSCNSHAYARFDRGAYVLCLAAPANPWPTFNRNTGRKRKIQEGVAFGMDNFGLLAARDYGGMAGRAGGALSGVFIPYQRVFLICRTQTRVTDFAGGGRNNLTRVRAGGGGVHLG